MRKTPMAINISHDLVRENGRCLFFREEIWVCAKKRDATLRCLLGSFRKLDFAVLDGRCCSHFLWICFLFFSLSFFFFYLSPPLFFSHYSLCDLKCCHNMLSVISATPFCFRPASHHSTFFADNWRQRSFNTGSQAQHFCWHPLHLRARQGALSAVPPERSGGAIWCRTRWRRRGDKARVTGSDVWRCWWHPLRGSGRTWEQDCEIACRMWAYRFVP